MATRTVPFCLEMLTFGPPRELRHTSEIPEGIPDAGGAMATRSVPFSLEMLTIQHSERSRRTPEIPDAGVIMATRSVPFSLEMLTIAFQLSSIQRADRELDARRAYERDL